MYEILVFYQFVNLVFQFATSLYTSVAMNLLHSSVPVLTKDFSQV